MIIGWIEESYRLVVPKRLTSLLGTDAWFSFSRWRMLPISVGLPWGGRIGE